MRGLPRRPTVSDSQLAGKVVAITGGGRGIGAATAEALVGHGARVAIGDIDPERAAAVTARLRGQAVASKLDVTDERSFDAFLAEAEEQLGPLDVLINNAGIMPIGPFLEQTSATADHIVDVNLRGVIIGCRLGLGRMVARRHGHVINVSSQAGRLGSSGAVTYCASKAAVITLTHGLQDEFASSGVQISCVMPGVVSTELSAGLAASEGFLKAITPQQVADAIARCVETRAPLVHVPRIAGAGIAALAPLPIAIRQRLERFAGTQNLALRAAGSAERAEYERRVAGGRAG
jgi:NAD(P)-dependent dehydrogenase (short-subunit alcohol dehydrogenase family)